MHTLCKGLLLATTALGLGLTAAGTAQAQARTGNETVLEDVIVTARRVEERLQDVPVSITVFNQEALTKNNVTSAKDLTLYTPSLQSNNRYGGDNTTFTIRGFTQEQRTFSTVGTFFADVVMPRGSGATQGGDGAGAGALFDLQNVQVLKGPQGTLFGRNVTGGAVLLVPQKPVDRFEGYLEGGAGNYDMRRLQGVINVPLTENVRARLGMDHMERDGYLKNIGAFGDGLAGRNKGMGSTDYWAWRLSVVADLTPDLENYFIASYTQSKSNPVIPKVTKCYPGVTQALGPLGALRLGDWSCDQVAREAQHDFWTVSNRNPGAVSNLKTWQIINTTTWQASKSLTVKNIFSYGEILGTTNIDLFGNYMISGAIPGQETSPNQVTGFAFTSAEPAKGHTNAQSSLVEELQFQGNPSDRFIWQAGLYMELNEPLGYSGVQTASFTPCAEIQVFNCLGPTPNQSAATGSFSVSKTTFRDYAAYGQASYDITDQLKATAGLRYTKDEVRTELHNETIVFTRAGAANDVSSTRFRCTNLTAPGFGPTLYTADQRYSVCQQDLRQNSSAWTWLLDVDYKPTDDVMVYAKWSRGYRQGGLAIFGPDPIQAFEPEKVDTYEIGAKTTWRGAMPGYFNVAGYYNDFRNQQLQFGVACVSSLPGFTVTCPGNAAIINAGSSEIYGVELEAGVRPFDGMRLDVSYGYLKSKLKEIEIPAAGSLPPYNSFTPPVAGDVIPNAGPPHKVVVTASYTLPLSEDIGRITFGGTYVYQDAYRSVVDGVPGSGNGILPSANILNLNATWEDILSRPVDASFFMTNVTNEHIYQHANDNQLRGFVSYFIGEPRMYGFRLRYKFGG